MEIKDLKKVNSILIFSSIILALLYLGAPLLIPLTFAIFFATLILPVSNFLEKKFNAGKITSSLISTLIIFISVGLIFFYFIYQLGIFLNDIIDRKEVLIKSLREIQNKIAVITGYSLEQQEQALRERSEDMVNAVQNNVSNFLLNITGIILNFLLVLVFLFLLLLNRAKFVDFLMRYVREEKEAETRKIIVEISKVSHQYLWGRIQVMTLLAIMYLITFIAYGLEHTGLLVIFGALITIIPYLGPLLSGILPILFMIVFGENPVVQISFAIIVFIIQLIESYVLEPVLMGSEMQQSPLFVIIAILVGGMIWGPAGLILFVPFFAIMKIIFDHTPELKPLGFLIGYERPGSGEGLIEKLKKKFKK